MGFPQERAGDKESARETYERIVREHPESPEAMAAKRALAIMKALKPESGTEGPTEPVEESKLDESPGGEKRIVIFRKEPYSLLTQEKVRLSTWEKIDFGVTAFTYGMSLAYVLSRRVDAIPPETPFIGAESTARFLATPTVRPDGSAVWTVGVAWGG